MEWGFSLVRVAGWRQRIGGEMEMGGKVIPIEGWELKGRMNFIYLKINGLRSCETVARACCQVIHKGLGAKIGGFFP
jgi:hypothetical protein